MVRTARGSLEVAEFGQGAPVVLLTRIRNVGLRLCC